MPSTILSDNGASSGTAGLKSTASNDGVLALQTTTAGGTATTAVSISTSQIVTITNDALISGLTVGKGAGAVSTNTAVGASALQANTTGSQNTAVGYQAGYSGTTITNLTAIGYQSGYSTTGGGNTFVGNYQSGYNITSGTNNTVLGNYNGNQGGLDIRTSSNNIVLSDGAGNPRAYSDGSGYFYINQIGQLGGYSEQAVITSTAATVALAVKAYADNICIGFTNGDTGTYTAAQFCNNGNFSGAGKGSITVSNSATAYNTSSDYRLKENVQPMTGALATVAQLKPVTYDWIADKSKGQGFIAHELQAVVPDCVTGEKDAVDANGKPIYQGVDTSFLVATLTAAIQELNATVTAQAAEIAALKAKVGV